MTSRKPTTVRFMNKNGRCNIRQNAEEKRDRYINDIFNTLIDMSWRNNLLFFVSTYIIAWSLFGFLWWMIALIRGDLGFYNVNGTLNQTMDHEPCAMNVHSYWSAFLFFVETETSVGYGKRAVTDKCPEGVLLFVVQALLGSILDSFMVGCIYIKIAQPKNRAETLVFSNFCTISLRDGKYCLMFRVANLRNSLIVQSRIRAKFVKSRETLEGEFIGLHQDDINVGFDSGADNLFLVTPLIISHEINHKSPFYEMDSEYLKNESFEIIVILEGLQESTGMICQARTSYLSSEVLWGHRFVPVLSYDVSHFRVDHAEFHKTYEVSMPNMNMLDYELMEGARHVQTSNSVMSVGSLAVPGKVGNGQHHDKHTIYKRKESVKNHHHNPHGLPHNLHKSLPSSNSVPVTGVTIVTLVDEQKPVAVVPPDEVEVWPDTSLNVSVQEGVNDDDDDDVPTEPLTINVAPSNVSSVTTTTVVTKVATTPATAVGTIVAAAAAAGKLPQSRSASNISVTSMSVENVLPSIEIVGSGGGGGGGGEQVVTRPVQRALSGGDLATIAATAQTFDDAAAMPPVSWHDKPNAKSHVSIPIPASDSM